jgi:hypothetical protein
MQVVELTKYINLICPEAPFGNPKLQLMKRPSFC